MGQQHAFRRVPAEQDRRRISTGTGRASAFVYHFDQVPPRPAGMPFTAPGAYHADELTFVFGTHPPDWPAEQQEASRRIQSYWVNFARSGDPNGESLPRWRPYAENRPVLWFSGGGARPGPVPRMEAMEALDAILGEP